MVPLAAGNSGVGSNAVRRGDGPFRYDQRAPKTCARTSSYSLSNIPGVRLLVGIRRRVCWNLFDPDRSVTLESTVENRMVTGLDLLFLEVNNLEESLAFYHDDLEFEIESHNPDADPPIACLRAGQLRINLVQQSETMLKRGRGVHFVFGVDDVDELHEQLSSRNLPVTAPKDEGWGGRFISVQDPDGYRLFFVMWERPR